MCHAKTDATDAHLHIAQAPPSNIAKLPLTPPFSPSQVPTLSSYYLDHIILTSVREFFEAYRHVQLHVFASAFATKNTYHLGEQLNHELNALKESLSSTWKAVVDSLYN